MVNETSIRVRYSETDQMGFAYYGRYNEWFEVARVEYLRALGFRYRDLEDLGIRLVVMEAHCYYRSPTRYDDLLKIRTWICTLKRFKIEFQYEILNEEGKRLSEGKTLIGSLDDEGKPRVLPSEVMETLRKSLEKS